MSIRRSATRPRLVVAALLATPALVVGLIGRAGQPQTVDFVQGDGGGTTAAIAGGAAADPPFEAGILAQHDVDHPGNGIGTVLG